MDYKNDLGLQLRIKTSYGTLLPAEKKIADYILENETTPSIDIDTLAKETKTSKASVSRFCRRLGYGGFKEFSLHLAQESMTKPEETGEKDYIQQTIEANAQACSDTRYLIEDEKIEGVARSIGSAKRIFLLGSSAIAPVILDFYQKMLRLGIVCHYDQGRRMQKMQAAVSGPGDLVIAFDLSGEARGTVEAAKTAQESGSEVITICCGIGSSLGEVGQTHLYGVGQKMDNYVTGTGETRISLLNIVDVIFYKLLEVLPRQQVEDMLNKTKEVIIEDWN